MTFFSTSKNTKLLPVILVTSVLGLLMFGGANQASAHNDPNGCTLTGSNISIGIFSDAGATNAIVGTGIYQGDMVWYKASMNFPTFGSTCAFEGGTTHIITPDGAVSNVTPGGGVACIGGTIADAVPSPCTTQQNTQDTLIVGYMVDMADDGAGGPFGDTNNDGDLRAFATYGQAIAVPGSADGASHRLALDSDSTNASSNVAEEALFCGDGETNGDEECDDGNDVDDDLCSNSCELAECGDGVTNGNEECDDGNNVDTDGCTNACELPETCPRGGDDDDDDGDDSSGFFGFFGGDDDDDDGGCPSDDDDDD